MSLRREPPVPALSQAARVTPPGLRARERERRRRTSSPRPFSLRIPRRARVTTGRGSEDPPPHAQGAPRADDEERGRVARAGGEGTPLEPRHLSPRSSFPHRVALSVSLRGDAAPRVGRRSLPGKPAREGGSAPGLGGQQRGGRVLALQQEGGTRVPPRVERQPAALLPRHGPRRGRGGKGSGHPHAAGTAARPCLLSRPCLGPPASLTAAWESFRAPGRAHGAARPRTAEVSTTARWAPRTPYPPPAPSPPKRYRERARARPPRRGGGESLDQPRNPAQKGKKEGPTPPERRTDPNPPREGCRPAKGPPRPFCERHIDRERGSRHARGPSPPRRKGRGGGRQSSGPGRWLRHRRRNGGVRGSRRRKAESRSSALPGAPRRGRARYRDRYPPLVPGWEGSEIPASIGKRHASGSHPPRDPVRVVSRALDRSPEARVRRLGSENPVLTNLRGHVETG